MIVDALPPASAVDIVWPRVRAGAAAALAEDTPPTIAPWVEVGVINSPDTEVRRLAWNAIFCPICFENAGRGLFLIDDRPDSGCQIEPCAALPPQAIDHARAIAISLDGCGLTWISVPKDQPWIVELYRAKLEMGCSQGSPIPRSIDIHPALDVQGTFQPCLLYTSPSPRDKRQSRMPSSA